jgi:cellulose synthase/poly-beta-1,6-N-acetylglucosamine synthase-like glycosyltransferase
MTQKIYSSVNSPKPSPLPLVSIIVPVHNERQVIERRIKNILDSSYPSEKMEVIVVDSGSDDGTTSIIRNRLPDQVMLIQEDRRNGKAHAINLALERCKGDIVIVTDAPTMYEKKTIYHLVKPFDDPIVGAVSVLYRIPNRTESKMTAFETLVVSQKEKVRILESKVSSTSWLSGEACAFRRKIIDAVSEDSLADDSNIALQVISRGYRAIVNENSYFIEKSPSLPDEYLKIKSRRALGGLQELLRFKFFLFNRRYGYFGMVIFPYRFFAQFISPVISLITLGLVIPTLIDITVYFGLNTAIVIALALLLVFSLERTKARAYLLMHLIMLRALMLLLLGKTDVRWYQSKVQIK